MDTLNNVSDFYLLVRVIEAGGFTAAAAETGIPRSRLSRRIIELEQRLGVRLLNRSTRSFAMTSTGEQVYRHALGILAATEAAEGAAREVQGGPSGLIRLAVPSLLQEVLGELLLSFSSSQPKVRLALGLHNNHTELSLQRHDLLLYLEGQPPDSADIVAHPIGQVHFVTVASPELCKRLGHLRHPDELDDRNCLGFGPPQAIRPWLLRNAAPRLLRQACFSSDNLPLLLDAARQGLGLAHLPFYACAGDLASGRLVRLFEAHEPPALPLLALTPPHRAMTPAIRALIQFIRSNLEELQEQGILLAS
ncbi:LysR substrate-binding domain-containing protein [Azotobacter chroococcum]|uniref:Transcriptional regulator, LysR family n=1 Tax=Azotobacter chroococcum NCIMB 8003 TaxID=1328314 RepID=A0A0C4WNA9_9GAMM|nr:LysR substrate-binding domain-containing protein [Azotobacter chroococcum]AJE20970.1 Transcriptional regulator, LysR family [Azotobacter chroococcum NCIMB 8003]